MNGLNGKDYMLGPYGSKESKEKYGRLIAQYGAAPKPNHFGTPTSKTTMRDVVDAFLEHAKKYYAESDEHDQYERAAKPIKDLYGSTLAANLTARDFRTIREAWIGDKRSRQYVNKQSQRILHIIKWAVSESLMPADVYTACKCVEPLKKGRCGLKEASKVSCVSQATVDQTCKHMTRVLIDMVKFQQFTGCRPGEVCAITPSMVNRSGDIWIIELDKHKTAWRGKQRIIFVGPNGQAVLKPYLLRAADSHCFSPAESERQRLEARHEARTTHASCGNKPGTNRVRRPKTQPGTFYTSGTYAQAIRYACKRAEVDQWAPNQLRHNRATAIRKGYGIEAASVSLGHSGLKVTEIYAEQDLALAMQVAREIG